MTNLNEFWSLKYSFLWKYDKKCSKFFLFFGHIRLKNQKSHYFPVLSDPPLVEKIWYRAFLSCLKGRFNKFSRFSQSATLYGVFCVSSFLNTIKFFTFNLNFQFEIKTPNLEFKISIWKSNLQFGNSNLNFEIQYYDFLIKCIT